MEGRGSRKVNVCEGKMTTEQDQATISTKIARIEKVAEDTKGGAPIVHLSHHIDLAWLREAYRRTRKDGATGIDGVTGDEYGADLERNLLDLKERFKSLRYRAPAARRVWIPKDKPGELRGLGLPTFEDKVLQRAVLMALEPVYEREFLDCSYGFRPGRSAHDAIRAVRESTHAMKSATVLEIDIRKCFDTIPHDKLREMLSHRIADKVLMRTIGKWLNAGIMEQGRTTHSDEGTPQGGVISPLLMNVYMHEVLDLWFETEVRPRLRGRAEMIRYADDAVLIFEHAEDAARVMKVIFSRFEKYGLTLHPEKTRVVSFQAPCNHTSATRSETFTFLGFTFYWGKTRKGNYTVKVKTSKGRLSRAKRRIAEWCRRNRHLPIPVQAARLKAKLQGHYAYYGVSFNIRGLQIVARVAHTTWRKWLGRRSQKARIGWQDFARIVARYPLPRPRIVHSLWKRQLEFTF